MSSPIEEAVRHTVETKVLAKQMQDINHWEYKLTEFLFGMASQVLGDSQPAFYARKNDLLKKCQTELRAWFDDSGVASIHLQYILEQFNNQLPPPKCTICDNTERISVAGLCPACQAAVKQLSTKPKRKPKQTP